MTSKALSNQVAAKWQDSFNRLNRGATGISGLMEFSRVRDSRRHLIVNWGEGVLLFIQLWNLHCAFPF